MMRRLCLPVALVLLSASTPAPAVELEPLLVQLRREAPLSEVFHEVRYRRALRAPLVSQGTLIWHGGDDFERRVESPYHETSRLQEGTLVVQRPGRAARTIALTRAPELEVLFTGLSALFSGDAEAIERVFEVELEGDRDWRLSLRPRAQRLRQRVPHLELRGQSDQVRCLILHQSGAEVLTVMGAASAPEPAADLAGQVAASCPSP